MNSQLSVGRAQARQQELSDKAARRRREHARPISWKGVTLRLATSADRLALEHLAELDETTRPAEPVLVGEVSQQPVAALSLTDGRVIADPFTETTELIQLLRLRAQQLGARHRRAGVGYAVRPLLARLARARP